MTNNIDKPKPIGWMPFIIPTLLVFVLWLLSPVLLHLLHEWLGIEKAQAEIGQFGDSFGAVNALYSGLAFAGLYYAIHLQRKELAETREILSSQKEEAVTQNKTLSQQTFESTFFHLLSLHNELLNSIDLRSMRIAKLGSLSDPVQGGNVISTGRDCFSTFFNDYKFYWNEVRRHNSGNEPETHLKIIDEAYILLFTKHEKDLGHYFRNLYNIIKFIDRSNVENKTFYTNLVRAQLSSNELAVLFYNCLSSKGREKFLPLVQDYSLIKNMNRNGLLDRTNHEGLYHKNAYGEA
jgi:hypothetical protein